MTYVDASEQTHIDALRSDIDQQLTVINKRMEEINVEARLEAAEQRMLQLQATLDKQLQASEERTNRIKEVLTAYHRGVMKEIKQLKKELYEKFEAHKQQARQTIYEAIHPWKSEKNRLAPVSKLPVELLSLIFTHYIHDPDLRLTKQDLELQLYSGRNIEPDPCSSIKWADIVRVVRVCRTWRETALKAPDFWSQILMLPLHRMVRMLDRSKQSLLYVRLSPSSCSDYWWSTYARLLLADNMERIRELHLDISSTNIDRILKTISISSSCKSPELRSLYIRGGDRFHRREVDPSNLHLICMPNLQHLDISRHPIDWRLLHKAAKQSGFRRLVSLKLERSRSPPAERCVFYDILSVMPSLQILSLINALPPCSPSQPALERRVSLPYLSSCTILSTPSECANFHTHVSYPTTTAKLHFQLKDPQDVSLNDNLGLLGTLLEHWGLSKANPKRGHSNLLLLVTHQVGFHVKAIVWDGPFPERLHNYDFEGAPVVLDFSMTRSEISSQFLKLIFICGLRNIGLKFQLSEIPWPENCWRSFFQHQEQVTYLHIRSLFFKEIIYGFSSSWVPTASGHYQKNSSHRPSLLPNLRRLVVEEHGEPLLVQSKDEDNDVVPSVHMNADIGALMDYLNERYNHNSPLQEVHFSACYGWTATSFSKLSELVQTVTWSGWVPPYESAGDSDSDESYVTDSDGADTDEEGDDGEENEDIHLTTRREGSDVAALSSNSDAPADSGSDPIDNEGGSEDDDSEEWPDDTTSESDTADEFWP